MLEFVHLTGSDAGKDNETRKKVRSQAMRDFRRRQRAEREAAAAARASTSPASVSASLRVPSHNSRARASSTPPGTTIGHAPQPMSIAKRRLRTKPRRTTFPQESPQSEPAAFDEQDYFGGDFNVMPSNSSSYIPSINLGAHYMPPTTEQTLMPLSELSPGFQYSWDNQYQQAQQTYYQSLDFTTAAPLSTAYTETTHDIEPYYHHYGSDGYATASEQAELDPSLGQPSTHDAYSSAYREGTSTSCSTDATSFYYDYRPHVPTWQVDHVDF